MDKALEVAYTLRDKLCSNKIKDTRDKYYMVSDKAVAGPLCVRGCMGGVHVDANDIRGRVKYFIAKPTRAIIADYNKGHPIYKSIFIDKKLNDHLPYGSSEEHADYFLDYILNRSPWANVFITKDPGDVRTKGIIIDANHDLSLVTTATVAVRTLLDYPDFAYNFYQMRKLLQDEYPENLQYILSALLKYSPSTVTSKILNKTKTISTWMVDSTQYQAYGNVMWFKSLTPSGVTNFLNNAPIENNNNFLSKDGRIDRYKMWVRNWQSDGPLTVESGMTGKLPVQPDKSLRKSVKMTSNIGSRVINAYKKDGVRNLAEQILKYSISKEASK